MEFKHLETQTLRNSFANQCLGKAGLAEGTNAGTIQIAAAITYCIAGVLYSKAITDNIAVTAGAVQADLTECMYLISIDSAGAVTTTKGVEAATGTGVTLPATPDGDVAIGAIKVVTSGGTFTAGTTDLGDAAVTDTYYDLIGNVVTTF